MYKATEVAKFIIRHCAEKGYPISNLKLQKLIYFAWVDYYKKTRKELFVDPICAWQLGPVVPDVYYEYCSYAGRAISPPKSDNIKAEDKKILSPIIEKYMCISAHHLVNITHNTGTAWDKTFRHGYGNREQIPFELIKEIGV